MARYTKTRIKKECNRATTIVRGHARSTIQNDLSTLPIRSIELHPIATSKKLYTMGPIPPIAKLVPEKLRRFCEGLRYPHTLPFLLPTFVIGLSFSPFIPPTRSRNSLLSVSHWFFLQSALELPRSECEQPPSTRKAKIYEAQDGLP